MLSLASNMKLLKTLHLPRIIILVVVLLLGIPLFVHYYLSKISADRNNEKFSSYKLEAVFDINNPEFSDLKVRIEEMLNIKASVMNELRELEHRRQALQLIITKDSQKAEELRGEVNRQQTELDRSKVSLEQTKLAQKELWSKNFPELILPKRLFATASQSRNKEENYIHERNFCQLHSCFDYSRCSISSNFPVYLYDIDEFSFSDIPEFVKTSASQAFGYNLHTTDSPVIACLYVVLVGEVNSKNESIIQFENWLHALPYWGGDGRNHLILYFKKNLHSVDLSFLPKMNTGKALIGQSYFHRSEFRRDFDVVIPTLMGIPGGEVWEELQPISPAQRNIFLSFVGEYSGKKDINSYSISNHDNDIAEELYIVDYLKSLKSNGLLNSVDCRFSCSVSSTNGLKGEWWLCDSEATRMSKLRESTFALILSPTDSNILITSALTIRLYEALKAGAIPVILGNHIVLPFSEVVDWRKAAIILPKARITELHFILRSVPDNDVLFLRKQGRYIWENYLSSTQSVIDTTLALIRERIGIPPATILDEPSVGVFNQTKKPENVIPVRPESEVEETLGPLESSSPSPKYLRNYTFFNVFNYELWNKYMDPFHLYPSLPFDPILPSEAKFIGSTHGFRPIGQGTGGSGKEFSESLGGNHPREQFTVVMLTYEREQVLMASLSRLYGLPYLNKVIVIWNSPQLPSNELKWPDIGVPIVVIKAERNSLNNRFLPYDEIETDAILSADDDAHLRPDEIIFGFRVWREARDRVVGFPGRFHAWDNSSRGWNYNSNYSCELSMVLTGAAFFHKYYTYQYSYIMPQAIRDKVDEFMNCEDIAMNFLVSHIIRKPPIKVTSRWTFRCPGCPATLSEDETHFNERHKCINFFTQVYGYMPLLNTQFRADSILFKTRIPHDKQKCFKFI